MRDEESVLENQMASVHGAVVDPSQIPVADRAKFHQITAVQQSSPIFKLTVDCCDEIFEYLSLKDLHSFGHTCRAMQKVAGEYFKQNYSTIENITEEYAIYTICDEKVNRKKLEERIETSGFNQFIASISNYYIFSTYLLHYIHANIDEFPLINHITLVGFNFSDDRVESIQNLLSKVECVEIRDCHVNGDFYELFLKYCVNVKQLYVQECDVGFYDSDDEDAFEENRWLVHQYPKLEHFELRPGDIVEERPEIFRFFQLNPNIRTFSTTADCVWANRNELLRSNAKLDIFEVKIFTPAMYFNLDFSTEQLVQSIRNLFYQLYERGFYKRLFLYLPKVDQPICDLLESMQHLDKLCIREYGQICGLPALTNLKELAILEGAKATDMDILANSYTNLQRIYIENASIDDVMPFICRSPKLNKVKVIPKDGDHFNEGILPLVKLNREREKLDGARKVTIYVPDNIFLKTKWATRNGDINLRLIEMKRAHSYEWNHHFS